MNKPPIPEVPMKLKKTKEDFRKFCKGEPVTKRELGNFFGVTRTALDKWISAGLKEVGKIGRNNIYDTAYVTQWKIDKESYQLRQQLIEATTEDESGMSGFDAKRRKEIAQALTAELDLAIKREQVANIDDLMEDFSEALIQVRAKLVSMSSRLSGILSHKDDEGVGKLLDSEVSDMLEVLSDYE